MPLLSKLALGKGFDLSQQNKKGSCGRIKNPKPKEEKSEKERKRGAKKEKKSIL